MLRSIAVTTVALLALTACNNDPPPQYPPQPYPQQYPPPQPYPQPPPPPAQPYPQPPAQPYPQPPTTTPVPQPGGTGTPTAIPGVEKRPDGTCWATPPQLTDQPPVPFQVPCPPGS